MTDEVQVAIIEGCVGDPSVGGRQTNYQELNNLNPDAFYRLNRHSLSCDACFRDPNVRSALLQFERESCEEEERVGLELVSNCIGQVPLRKGMLIQHKVGPDLSFHGLVIDEHLTRCPACQAFYEEAHRHRGQIRGFHYFSQIFKSPYVYAPDYRVVQYKWDIEFQREEIDRRLSLLAPAG